MHAELQLDNQICFRLYTAARLITQAYTPMLNKLGITYPQYLVLMVLWEQDSQPVNDIAHRLLLETNTVTPLLQRMEKLGIVTRKKGEQDKRQQIVSLTQRARLWKNRLTPSFLRAWAKSLRHVPSNWTTMQGLPVNSTQLLTH